MRTKRPLLSWVMACAVMLALVVSFCARHAEVRAAKRRLAEVEQEIAHLEAMNELLVEQAKMMQSPAYIEKVAREKLGLVMPGEIQYLLVTSTPN